jgi:hypothetical protein
MKQYSENEIISKIINLPSFKGIPLNYWILGIRSKSDTPDKFDDSLILFHNKTIFKYTTGTTNPGLSILKNGWKLYNKSGAAVVKSEEWYYNLWTPGMHKGKIQALIQLGNKIKYFRDDNNNTKSEEIGKFQEGYIGINFHPATYKLAGIIRMNVGGWSAGCQVSNNDNDYKFIIDEIFKSKQPKITYCLINEF